MKTICFVAFGAKKIFGWKRKESDASALVGLQLNIDGITGH